MLYKVAKGLLSADEIEEGEHALAPSRQGNAK